MIKVLVSISPIRFVNVPNPSFFGEQKKHYLLLMDKGKIGILEARFTLYKLGSKHVWIF